MMHAEAGGDVDGWGGQDVAEEGQGQGQVRRTHALIISACSILY